MAVRPAIRRLNIKRGYLLKHSSGVGRYFTLAKTREHRGRDTNSKTIRVALLSNEMLH